MTKMKNQQKMGNDRIDQNSCCLTADIDCLHAVANKAMPTQAADSQMSPNDYANCDDTKAAFRDTNTPFFSNFINKII
jgi:hypothetical protein